MDQPKHIYVSVCLHQEIRGRAYKRRVAKVKVDRPTKACLVVEVNPQKRLASTGGGQWLAMKCIVPKEPGPLAQSKIFLPGLLPDYSSEEEDEKEGSILDSEHGDPEGEHDYDDGASVVSDDGDSEKEWWSDEPDDDEWLEVESHGNVSSTPAMPEGCLPVGARIQMNRKYQAWQVWLEFCPAKGLPVGMGPGQCRCGPRTQSTFRRFCSSTSSSSLSAPDDVPLTSDEAKDAAVSWAWEQLALHTEC